MLNEKKEKKKLIKNKMEEGEKHPSILTQVCVYNEILWL
jgi:hypothetical protein